MLYGTLKHLVLLYLELRMNELRILKELKEKLRNLFKEESTGHDISHLERVLSNALELQKHEGGDLYVVAVAALTHDIHRLISNQCGYFVSAEKSLDEVKKLLLSCSVDLTKLDLILEVVKNHDNKDNKNFCLETLIIQDADVLDAIGEIGLQRTLKYCNTHKIPLSSDKSLDCADYIADINPISTCHYVYRTMIPNAKNLYTKTARKMAKDKIKMLEDFVKVHYKRKQKEIL